MMEPYSAAEKLPTSTRGGLPWLVVIDGKEQTFYSMEDPSEVVRQKIDALYHNYILTQSPHGWLILVAIDFANRRSSYSFWNTTTLETIELPTLDDITFQAGTLMLPPDHPDCRVVLINKFYPRVAHCKLRGGGQSNKSWIVQDLSECLHDIVVCRGTVYAISGEDDDCCTLSEVTMSLGHHDMEEESRISVSMLVSGGAKTVPNCNVYKRRLVDSDGELLQIVICLGSCTLDEFLFIVVFKLDMLSMTWVQLQTLGGRSLFINKRFSFSCSSFGGRIKPNCVYYFRDDYQTFAFDIERGQLSCSMLPLPPPEFDPQRKGSICVSFLWQQANPQSSSSAATTKLQETYKEDEEEEETLILKLPSDIHFNIAKRHLVSVSDYRNFHDSCKRFRLAAPIISSESATPLQSPSYPWFFSFEHCMTVNLKLHDLRCRNTFITHLPVSLSDSCVILAKERWLVTMKSNPTGWKFHLYNPFTKVVRNIPDMEAPTKRVSFGFSTAPTSPYCSIIGVYQNSEQGVVVKFMESSEAHEWHNFRYPGKKFRPRPRTASAFLANKFYFLDAYKQLGVFSYGRNVEGQLEHKWDVYDWKLLGHPAGLAEVCFKDRRIRSLVECGGKILAVIMDYLGKSVGVYMFNQEEEGWLEVDNLGSHMLFVSETGCFSAVAKIGGMGNKIYLPRVSTSKGSLVFYSLDTHKYHTFDEEVMDDLRHTWKVQLSGWFEPPNNK